MSDIKKVQISKRHFYKLENFILKHVNKYLTSNKFKKSEVVHEIKKSHHRLIRKKVLDEECKNDFIDRDVPHTYFSASHILQKYGYFQNGLPEFSEELEDGAIIERPYHRIRKSWIKSLSIKFSKIYKEKYNELPPIGYSQNGNSIINSRNNLYLFEPEYEQIVHEFMQAHPEERWFETESLVKERVDKSTERAIRLSKKNKNRVELFLQDKEFLVLRIKRSKQLTPEEKTTALKEYNKLVESCKKDMAKNVDMHKMFMEFRTKHKI